MPRRKTHCIADNGRYDLEFVKVPEFPKIRYILDLRTSTLYVNMCATESVKGFDTHIARADGDWILEATLRNYRKMRERWARIGAERREPMEAEK